jgi:hypothetical protein
MSDRKRKRAASSRWRLGILAAVVIVFSVLAIRPSHAGEWKSRTEEVWDEASKATVNRVYRVWDFHPELNLDFQWLPDDQDASYPDGVVSGSGRLTWSRRDQQAYSADAEVSVYTGVMRNGRPEGRGVVVYRTGLTYTGDWQNGLFNGHGTLHLANGDDYEGEFQAGQLQGTGRYSFADGSIYVGGFRASVRDGAATYTLPDGRSFQTVWAAGRLAQPAVPIGSAAPSNQGDIGTRADGLAIRVLVDRPKNQDALHEDGIAPFVYEAERQPGVMRVALSGDGLMDIWKGNGVLGSNQIDFEPAQFWPVLLAADVENRGSGTLRVTDAYLTVIESVTDLQPFLQAFSGTELRMCGMARYEPRITFANHGWGGVNNAALEFSLGTNASRTSTFVDKIGDFTDTGRDSIEGDLVLLGVRVARLRNFHYTCESVDALNVCLKRIEASGDFGQLAGRLYLKASDVYTTLAGRVSYDWTDIAGRTNHRTSPVMIEVPLLHIDVESPECGAAGPAEYAGRVVKLQLDKRGYRLPLNWHGDLAPREDKRFAFSLVAPKASHHLLRLTVELADGSSLNSLLVDLSYFRPAR